MGTLAALSAWVAVAGSMYGNSTSRPCRLISPWSAATQNGVIVAADDASGTSICRSDGGVLLAAGSATGAVVPLAAASAPGALGAAPPSRGGALPVGPQASPGP